ncbi:hypothetical protein EKO04_011225 [Ascochyta lentis]|uniref:Uncharacterized protein n=1 Tax=Ascochyta lentis TaxID=205686 RepID=A0A8H7IVN4_9PLEO|nr:hypothetical protein EKO04_011225 [Ascochyta lentis]
MDQNYQNLRAAVMKQLEEAQGAAGRDHQLRERNRKLERMLAVSADKLAVERGKASAAAKEASKWKMQYHGLRRTLQDALGNQL